MIRRISRLYTLELEESPFSTNSSTGTSSNHTTRGTGIAACKLTELCHRIRLGIRGWTVKCRRQGLHGGSCREYSRSRRRVLTLQTATVCPLDSRLSFSNLSAPSLLLVPTLQRNPMRRVHPTIGVTPGARLPESPLPADLRKCPDPYFQGIITASPGRIQCAGNHSMIFRAAISQA
jgi:hypothetical protein